MQRAQYQRRLSHHSLQEAVQRYRREVEKSNIIDLTEPDNLTWSTIFDKAREAEQRYEVDGKGVKGAHRKLGRTVGDHASAFQAWAQLVPDSDYTSAIRGGLNIIFTAAAEMANVRGIILDFFGDLPDTACHMQRLQKLHAKDDATYAISLQFNEALLRAFEGTINWLTEGQNKKHFKSIFLPDEGSKSIKDLLQSMEKQVRRMEERTNELVAQRVGETHRNTNQSRVELPVIRHDANLAAINTDKILESLSRQNIQSQHDREQLARIEQYGVDAKNGMFNLLFQRAFSAAWSQGLYQGRMLAVSAPFMDQGELFAALGVDEKTIRKDLRSTQNHGHRMDTLSQGGALWLMKCPLFIDRLYSNRPGALFVERDCPPGSQDAFEKMSAFSALTAMLTSTIGSMQPAKVVQFFCGRHTSSNDPLGGPSGLIRGILAQLLQLDNFSLSFIDSRTPKEYIERHSLAQLTDTLKRLVHQLDRRVILFIFVDGVSLFERSEWIQDLNKVM